MFEPPPAEGIRRRFRRPRGADLRERTLMRIAVHYAVAVVLLTLYGGQI